MMKKKVLLFVSLLFISSLGFVQAQDDANPQAEDQDILQIPEQKNLVKLNLFPLIVDDIALEYERAIAPKMTIGAMVSYRPESNLPFLSIIKKNVKRSDKALKAAKLETLSFAPELRFYLGKKGANHGFYIGPYIKYAMYSLDFNVIYDDNSSGVHGDVPLSGDLTGMVFGFSIGAEWQLGKNIFLDWRIMGPGYGFSNGSLKGYPHLDKDNQEAVKNKLDEMKLDDFPIVDISYKVESDKVEIDSKGPFANVRAALSIGYRF